MADALDDFLDRLTQGVESTGSATARNPRSSASGAYQMLDRTWRDLGNTGSAADAPPEVQRGQAYRLAAQNYSILNRLGLPTTSDVQYLAWQQGPGGAEALLKYPDDTAIDALIKGGVKPALAEQSVLLNGGTRDMKASEFAKRVEARFTGAKMPAAQDASAGGAVPPYLQALIGLQEVPPDVKAAQAQADKARQTEGEALKRGEAQREGLEGAFSVPAPGAPDQQQVPAEPKEERADPTRVLGQFLPLMAILGGALGRTHSFAALKAASGAMKAAKANDDEALKLHHQQWLDAMEQIKANNEAAQVKFDDAMKSWDSNRADAISKLNLIAAEEGNSAMQAAFAAGNFDEAFKMWDTRIHVAGSLAEITDRAANMKMEQERLSIEQRRANLEEQRQGATDEERLSKDMLAKPSSPALALQAAASSSEKIQSAITNPQQYVTFDGGAQIADTFTQAFNGGRAIRGFQMNMLSSDRNVWQRLQAIANTWVPGTAGGHFTAQEVQAMAKAVVNLQPLLRQGFNEQAEDTLRKAVDNGDPNPIDAIPSGLTQFLDPALATKYSGGDKTGGGTTYTVGQIIEHGGKKYRVTGGDMANPDIEEVK